MSFSSFIFPKADSVLTGTIKDGEIVNADVSTSAAIAWSKMATTGTLTATQIDLNDTNATHQLSILWNEDDTADRTLNLLVVGGTRSLTFNENFTIGNG